MREATVTRPKSEKLSARQLILREWTWRIGEEGARHWRAMIMWRIRISLVALPSVIAVIVGATTHLLAVGLVGWAGLVLAIVGCGAMSGVELARWHRSTSEALGVPQGMRSGVPEPPTNRDRYLAWCQRYNVRAYPFLPADSPMDHRRTNGRK